MSESQKKKMGDLLVAVTTFSGIAQILMRRLLRDGSSLADIDDFQQGLTRRLKGLDIEGLTYDQQATLIARAMEAGDKFFEEYRKKIEATNGRNASDAASDAPQGSVKPSSD